LKNQWARQSPIQSLNDLYAHAPELQANLNAIGNQIGDKIGARYFGSVKENVARVQEKLVGSKTERSKPPSRINDVVRGSFIVDVPVKADAIVADLARHYELADEGWTTTHVGYTDRKVVIRMPNGQGAEVQLLHPDLYDAKENRGGRNALPRRLFTTLPFKLFRRNGQVPIPIGIISFYPPS
jgi:hypothetical protein